MPNCNREKRIIKADDMKIAFVTKRVSDTLGGAERVSLNVLKKLADSGHDVHVFTQCSDTLIEGINLHTVKVSGVISPWRLLSFQWKVMSMIKAGHFDLIYSLSLVYPVDIYRVGDGIHQYWMRIQHPNLLFRWIKYLTSLVHLAMRYLEKKVLRENNCRYFITNSILIKNQLKDFFNIPDEKIKVIYNGVDHDLFNTGVQKYRTSLREKYQIGDNDLVVLSVSNNWERKGLSTIIRAISQSGNQKIKLVVVGRGKKSVYVSLARDEQIDPQRIIFTGIVGNVDHYYGMADIFIHPTRYEPFANVCLEAMACGLPVITTRMNGAAELIVPGENGFILQDWNDAESLADMMKELNDLDVKNRMGEKAAATAQAFTWGKHMEELGNVFRSLTS